MTEKKEIFVKKENSVKKENLDKKTIVKKMVEVDFIGKELLNNSIFDTTMENVAKEHNFFDPKRKYSPLTIIIGEKELHAKVEKELETMKAGEEKTVLLNEKEGFGERQGDYVRILPLKVFKEQKMNPVPGLIINTGNLIGKVQSVSGGRVRVDFNHPLAGRNLEYYVKVNKEFIGVKEKSEKLFEKYYSQIPGARKEFKEEILYITLPSSTLKNLDKINNTIIELGKSLGVIIKFVEGKEIVKVENKEVQN